MRRHISAQLLLGAASIAVAPPALAQTAVTDPAQELQAAQQAIDRAQTAVEQAQFALDKAREALKAAREASSSARGAAGLPVPDMLVDSARRADRSAAPPVETAASGTTSKPAAPVMGIPVHPAGAAVASEGGELAAGGDKSDFGKGLARSIVNGPNSSPLKSSQTPDLQFIASAKDKIGSIAWTLDLKSNPSPGWMSADQLTFTASSKLDDNSNADIVGLDGFSNGAELKFAWTHYATRFVPPKPTDRGNIEEAERRCAEVEKDPAKCDAYGYSDGGVSVFVKKYYPEGLRPLLDLILPEPVWYYGAGFNTNQASYKYLDRAAFAPKKDDHFGYGGTVFGGAVLPRGLTSIGASIDYKRKYKAADELTLCQPLSGSIQSQCYTLPDGAPTRQDAAIFGVELRHAFAAKSGASGLAVAPKASFDVANDAWSIDVPVYFVGDGAGKLRGGVRGVYLNQEAKDGGREDSFAVGLFVGVPFTVFKP